MPPILLTFNRCYSYCACYWLTVEAYIPDLRRCLRCQSFRHVTCSCWRLQCDLTAVCVSCGKADHDENYSGPVKCYRCGGPHPSSSKDSDRYKYKREILQWRTQEEISFLEAKKRVMTWLLRPGVTSASVFGNLPLAALHQLCLSQHHLSLIQTVLPQKDQLHPPRHPSREWRSWRLLLCSRRAPVARTSSMGLLLPKSSLH